MSLPPNRRLFVRYYLIDRNATQAAIRAGYSEDTAGQTGHELLKNPEVAAAIAKGEKRLADKADIAALRVIEEFRRIAFSNPADLLEWEDGKLNLLNSDQVPDEVMACISEVRQTQYGLVIKFHDKNKALDALARHLGLFEKDNRQKGAAMGAEEAAKAMLLDKILAGATSEQLEVLDDLFSNIDAEADGPETRPATH